MVVQSLKSNIWLAFSNSIGNAVYAFAYWWGSQNLLEGRYTQTQFFIVLFAMLVSAQLWGQLFTLAPEISRARAAMSRIVGLIELDSNSSGAGSGKSTPESYDELDEKRDIEAVADAETTTSGKKGASVEFRAVSFSYPARPNIPVLTSLSLSIQPGQFCALVGPSGRSEELV